jgi:hypothetical protein
VATGFPVRKRDKAKTEIISLFLPNSEMIELGQRYQGPGKPGPFYGADVIQSVNKR